MQVTDKDFAEHVLQSEGVTIVDFWADWCTPCKMLDPILEQVAEEFKGKGVKVVKLDVDNNPQTAMQFGIMSLPTMLVFKGGTVKGQLIGVQPKDVIKAGVDRALQS